MVLNERSFSENGKCLMRQRYPEMRPNDENSVDPDQIAPMSSQGPRL